MSERPTPETDAFMTRIRGIDGDKHWVPADTSRRLERERDEAIRKRDETRSEVDELAAVINELTAVVKGLRAIMRQDAAK